MVILMETGAKLATLLKLILSCVCRFRPVEFWVKYSLFDITCNKIFCFSVEVIYTNSTFLLRQYKKIKFHIT